MIPCTTYESILLESEVASSMAAYAMMLSLVILLVNNKLFLEKRHIDQFGPTLLENHILHVFLGSDGPLLVDFCNIIAV